MQFEQQVLAMVPDPQFPTETLISISVGTNSMNTPAISSFVLRDLPSLLSLRIGKQSCRFVDRFELYNLQSLREVVVEDDAFSPDMNMDEMEYASGRFACTCCLRLERLVLSEFTFVGFREFILESRWFR